MFNNLSVTRKGLAAFLGLALVGVIAGIVSFDRASVAERAIMQATQANNLLVEGRTVEGAIMSQAFSLQGFVLTGDRRRLAAFEAGVPEFQAGFDTRRRGGRHSIRSSPKPVSQAKASWDSSARELMSPRKSSACAIVERSIWRAHRRFRRCEARFEQMRRMSAWSRAEIASVSATVFRRSQQRVLADV